MKYLTNVTIFLFLSDSTRAPATPSERAIRKFQEIDTYDYDALAFMEELYHNYIDKLVDVYIENLSSSVRVGVDASVKDDFESYSYCCHFYDDTRYFTINNPDIMTKMIAGISIDDVYQTMFYTLVNNKNAYRNRSNSIIDEIIGAIA